MFITLIWLVITAPLSRALEPLQDPALLVLSDDGHPIARRGALKEAPVEVAKLNSLTPAAFIAIEDRRFYRHWGIDPRGMGRAFVANLSSGGTVTEKLWPRVTAWPRRVTGRGRACRPPVKPARHY